MKVVVGVFFGGKSTEHEISCISANQAIQAISKEKYDVLPIYISKNNEFFIGEELFDIKNYADIVSSPEKILTKVAIYKDDNGAKVLPVKSLFKKTLHIDIAFLVVHGTNVEDGTLAGFIKMLDIPYTSCDVLGGAIGQDKAVMKNIFKAEKISMVDYFVVYGDDFNNQYDEYVKKAQDIGFPLIAKPANLGSSIGIEIINSIKDFKNKINECLKYDSKVVVERKLENFREVNISCLQTTKGLKLSAIEEVTKGFLDFEKKYLDGGKTKSASKGSKSASKGMASTSRKVPALLSEVQQNKIEESAKKVYKILNAFGTVRIDYLIDSKGEVYCNEINTIPGSLAFYLWKEVGLEFDQECQEMIDSALKRYRNEALKTYSFDTNILDGYKKR